LTIPKLIKRSLFIACLAPLTFLVSECNSESKAGRNEGLIEFSTRAVDQTHPLYGFAPDAATLKYKGEKFVIEMSTMGMFNYSIIGDNKARTLAQTVKFMNLKQACIENEKDLKEDNADYALNIEETTETKEIIGLKCYRVNVSKVSDPTQKWVAWYTRELGMENCNSLTPYAPVKGILLDYRIKKMGMEMHFLAKSAKDVKIPDNTFNIPATMKIIPKEEMEKFFHDLQ
jgi:hypothetical protein